MLRLKRFYNQNRKGIWLMALIIAFLFIILQLSNMIAHNQNSKRLANNNAPIFSSVPKKENNITVESTKSAVSGEEVSSSRLNEQTDAIKKFINYCKQQKIEEAYQMLTEECKEEMFHTLDDFYNLYYIKMFSKTDIESSIENWHGNTYKIKMYENMLTTGKANTKDVLQDYITLVKKDNDYQLNINSYIGREETKKSKEEEDYTITVVQKNVYMDYEKYTIEVENHSQQDILLDTMRNENTMYLEDNFEGKYGAYNHELSMADLTVTQGNKKQITVKYYSAYNSDKKIQKLVFSDAILNYNSNHKMWNDYETSIIQIAL